MMIPMVFWASFVPWLKLYAAAEQSWSRLKWVSADLFVCISGSA